MAVAGSFHSILRSVRLFRLVLLVEIFFLVATLLASAARTERPTPAAKPIDIKKSSSKAWRKLERSYRLRSISDLSKIERDCVDIATASLIVEKGLNPAIDIGKDLQTIDGITAAILDKMPGEIDPRDALQIISEHLHEECSFVPAGDMTDPREGFAHRVLANRKGNCLGLSTIYLAVGRRLGLRLFLVEAPGHAFVRYADRGVSINIETTDRGALVDDAFYRKKFEITPDRPYLRNLTRKEELSILLATRGVARYDHGEDDEAIADGTAAIVLGPNIAMNHSNRGAAMVRIGEFKRAIKDCTRAIELDVKHALAYSNRGAAWVRLKQTHQGMADLTTAVLLDPNDPIIYSNRSAAWFEMGRYRDAINDASRAIALDPNRAAAYFNRAKAYIEIGRQKLALRDLNKAGDLGMKIDPALVPVRRGRKAD